MDRVLPPQALENWKLLREKITPTVLERGILIPHPREDYDLLEERLLESLELRMPRILKCGHFHLNEEEEAELIAAAEEEEDDEANDADICTDCGRRVRDGRYGSGTGSRRWDIKIYAANGLMRAGAWGAAWREMERVDVEVCPFASEELKRELEMAKEQEEAEEAMRRAEQDLQDLPTGEEPKIETEQERMTQDIDEARMREIYGDDAQDYIDGLRYSPSPPRMHSTYEARIPRAAPAPAHQLPLSTLLRNYIVLLSRDPRNLAIALLSLLVLLLAMASRSVPSETGVSPAYNHAMAPTVASVSSSLSNVMPSPSAPVVETQRTETETETNPGPAVEEKLDGPEPEIRNAEEQVSAMSEKEEEDAAPTDTADQAEGEGEGDSATKKVLRAVDGMLEMMGGDEMAD